MPYTSARTSALALLELLARREARSAKDSIASVPQAPYASLFIIPEVSFFSVYCFVISDITNLYWAPLLQASHCSVISNHDFNIECLV